MAAGVSGRIDRGERPARLQASHRRGSGPGEGTGGAAWRGRSFADVLVRLRERGMTSAYLGVDGLNPNQAMNLYESLGSHHPFVRRRTGRAFPTMRCGAGGCTMTTMTDTPWIDLAGAPAIPGLRVRRWRDASDYPLLTDLANAASEEDKIPWVQTAENLQIEIEGEDGIDAASDIVIVEVDGKVVADAQVWRAVRDGTAMFEVSGHVLPAFRRRGIGRALLAENLRRAVERAALEPRVR